MMQGVRQKYYFPSIANKKAERMSNLRRRQNIYNSHFKPELISLPVWNLVPEDVMQTDLLPKHPPSGSCETIITAIDLISRYAFAFLVSDPTAFNTAHEFLTI